MFETLGVGFPEEHCEQACVPLWEEFLPQTKAAGFRHKAASVEEELLPDSLTQEKHPASEKHLPEQTLLVEPVMQVRCG